MATGLFGRLKPFFSTGKRAFRLSVSIGLFFLGFINLVNAQEADKVDWARFLSRHDLKWTRLTTDWFSGAFIGNGELGAMIYQENEYSLRWDIGRSDVTDHRDYPDVEWGKSRLPIGRMILKAQGKIINATMQLDLWNAEARGTITTEKGSITWRSFVSNNPDVIITESTETGTEKVQWEFIPEVSQSPTPGFTWAPPLNLSLIKEYQPNPPAQREAIRDIQIARQSLEAGGGYTTAWKVTESKKKRTKILYITVGYSFPANNHAAQAVERIESVGKLGVMQLVSLHRKWWHSYYPLSFLSIPDTRLESFYWIQQYKLASATRKNKQVLDLMGPWYNKTPWPALWWNLNVQLTYSPVYASNRLDLGESLINSLDANVQNLITNVPERYRHDAAGIGRISSYDLKAPLDVEDLSLHERFRESGNLTWALHNYWRQCKYAADDKRMVNNLFPLLQRSINYYRHLLYTGKDGKLHLPPTYSPEYTVGDKKYPDCNYDLSLLTWGCKTLLSINEEFNLKDPLAAEWKNIILNLADYPRDSATGLNIGLNLPLQVSHRHFSHLMMIYPLRVLKPDNAANRKLTEQSLSHWTGLKGALQGYTFTGAASISALLHNGNDAMDYLNGLLDKYTPPNTFYREGGTIPVIETPLSAVASVNEMMLQSYDGEIHVFPAVPDAWKEVSYHNLRTEGAFLVTARRAHGKAVYIKMESLAGGSFKLNIGSPEIEYQLKKSGGTKVIKGADGSWNIFLPKGKSIEFFGGTSKEDRMIEPVAAQQDKLNYYGLH
ncbi:MAG TPA: hypothetical protein VEY10_19105 [Flavisolibacter sp.]|nr:hypothetical protein [Flavisolibacter sp.]